MRRQASRSWRRHGEAAAGNGVAVAVARAECMLIARWIFALLAVAAVLCFGLYIGTHDPAWRRRGVLIVKWAVIAGLAFFAVLILERVAVAF
jgi:hypothetical protein